MYKSQRLSLSYPAIERLKQIYSLPDDVPPQTLAGYVERMIFEFGSGTSSQTPAPTPTQVPAPEIPEVTTPTLKPNFSKLAAMASKTL
ncbi:hypothetical protein [Nostoc sp.]|uniref:hypothetical protein n=1 Tax=Nostoc sp. TaxID=1180 RepID=UPI002FFBA8E8